MIKFTVILLYLFSIFLISIVFKKYNEDNKEIVRKIIHIGIGPLIPIAQFLKINQNSALIFTGIVSLMVFTNYNYKLFPTIEDVDRKSYGTLFYCLSLFILIYLFWDKNPYALISGFFIMTFGDGLAGLIGRSINSPKWSILNQSKSIAGTFTMGSVVAITTATISSVNHLGIKPLEIIVISLIGTCLEQISPWGIDNITVPIGITCLAIWLTGT